MRTSDLLFRHNTACVDDCQQVPRALLGPLHDRVILHNSEQLRRDITEFERLPVLGHALQCLEFRIQAQPSMFVLDLQPSPRLQSCSDTLHLCRKPSILGSLL